MAVFPAEILHPILIMHIRDPETTLYHALSLRLLSKDISTEVLHQLFTLGQFDVKDTALRLKLMKSPRRCRLCEVSARPEQRHRLMNRITLHRYLVGWLTREFDEPDKAIADEERKERWILWRTMTNSIVMYNARLYSHSFEPRFPSVEADQKKNTRSKLADAIITMYGVRNAWTYFGPHHERVGSRQAYCAPQRCSAFPSVIWCTEGMNIRRGDGWNGHLARRRTDRWGEEFWCLMIASYQGDLHLVQSFLDDLGMGPDGEWAETVVNSRASDMLDDWSTETSTRDRAQGAYQTTCLAAALTLAVRRGHDELASLLLGMGVTKLVCCFTRFWNGRTVLGTLFATTADSHTKTSAIAVRLLQRILAERMHRGFHVIRRMWCTEHLRLALDIPTKHGALLLKLIKALFSRILGMSEPKILNRLSNQLLCQAALTNDLSRAKLAAKLTSLNSGKSAGTPRSSLDDAYELNLRADEDEYGVQCHRLMNVPNPVRIAAALSHMEILEWLLSSDSRRLLNAEKPWQQKATSHKGYLILERQARIRVANDSVLLDCRREAVHAVFIDPERLPNSVKPVIDVKVLESILSKSKDLDWDREAIVAAGTKCADVFRVFVDHVDLGKQMPRRSDRRESRLFADGNYVCTIDEMLLHRSLKAGKLDNAKILFERCPSLPGMLHSSSILENYPQATAMSTALERSETWD